MEINACNEFLEINLFMFSNIGPGLEGNYFSFSVKYVEHHSCVDGKFSAGRGKQVEKCSEVLFIELLILQELFLLVDLIRTASFNNSISNCNISLPVNSNCKESAIK